METEKTERKLTAQEEHILKLFEKALPYLPEKSKEKLLVSAETLALYGDMRKKVPAA